VLCLAFILSAATLHTTPASPVPPQSDKSGQERPYVVYSPGTLPVTLSNGSGDRSLTVTVDGYGSFGSSTPAGDAIYDPIGTTGPSGTVYESAVYLTANQRFLTTDSFGGLSPVPFTNVTATSAQSAFTAGQFQVALTQTVTRTSSGSVLVQSYRFTNNGSTAQAFSAVRFVDGDLRFDGSIDDAGAVSSNGRTLSEFDAGDNPSAASTFVGISDSGGTPAGFTVQPYDFTDDIIEANGIPTGSLNQVANDNNGDRITDFGYDVTLSLASTFNVNPGQSALYMTFTRFGDQTLAARATLDWDAPDASSPLPLPPPEHLTATPIGSSAAPAAEPILWRRAEVTGYNVYASSTSPVAPTPENLFTSVPPTMTSAAVPTSSGGSFFVVTATYANGESPPSNEASADVPAATLTGALKVTSVKVVGKGTGFTPTVQVFLDGIPFVAPAKVKNGTKVVQKGTLVTGQTIGTYLASKGGVVLVQFRNSNGGIAARRFPN
jgi:hypothetical protein